MSYPQLRPLSFGEILDGAFSLYRRHFSTFFLAALIPALPVLGLGLLSGLLVGVADLPQEALLAVAALLVMAVAFVNLVVMVVQWGTLAYLVSRAYTGAPATLGEGLRRGLGRFFPLAVASFFIGLMMVGAMVPIGIAAAITGSALLLVWMIVAVLVAMALLCMFFAVTPAVVVEGHGPVTSLSRSRALAEGAWLRVFLIVVVAFLIAALPSWGLQTIHQLSTGIETSQLMLESPGRYFVIQAANTLLSAVTTPFVVGATVLLYYDRRVRAEALDVEIAAQNLASAG
jgi:hypothetical protein